MVTLSKEIQDAVVAKCQSQAADIVGSLSSALGLQFAGSITVEPRGLASLVTSQSDPGLIVLSAVGDATLVMAISNRDEILPAWCPDPTKRGKAGWQRLARNWACCCFPTN